MNKLVVISGGFHPFHAGHMALYTSAKEAFPDAQVVIGATNAQKDRPFPFKIKQKLAQVSGVPPKDFVEVTRQFSAEDPAIASRIKNPNDTILIFARSEKDKGEPPLPAQPDPKTGQLPLVTRGPNKGKPVSNYLQYFAGNEDNLEPMTQHAYMAYLPTVEFGPGITSASEIRAAWPTLNDKRKTAMVMSLYPTTQKNPKLAASVVKLMDAGMGEQTVTENDTDRFKKYVRPVVKTEPKIERTTNPAGRTTDHVEWKVTSPTGEIYRYKSKKQAQEHFDSFSKQGIAEGSENNNITAQKIFFARSDKTPKGWSYDHVGFITQDGRQIQMSGHKGNDVYVTNDVTDDPEFPKQNIKIVSLSKPVSVPTTNSVGAENCGTFVANVLQANGIKGIDTQKIYSVFKQPQKQGVAEGKQRTNEKINPEILSRKFRKQKDLGWYRLEAQGDAIGRAVTDPPTLKVVAKLVDKSKPENQWIEIGDAEFFEAPKEGPYAINNTGDGGLIPEVSVHPEYQRKGIATEMYKFIRELGNDIVRPPSGSQSADAVGLWGSFEKKPQGVAEGLSQNQGQVRQTLNAWMNKDQQFKNPTERAPFQAQVWPYIQQNIKTILADKGEDGKGSYPASPFAAWLLVQHMDAYPQNQGEFLQQLAQSGLDPTDGKGGEGKLQFLKDRYEVNKWIAANANNEEYFINDNPLPNPTVNVRNPAMFKDAGQVATSRKDALDNAIAAGNKLLVAAVQATKAQTQPSYKQGVAEGITADMRDFFAKEKPSKQLMSPRVYRGTTDYLNHQKQQSKEQSELAYLKMLLHTAMVARQQGRALNSVMRQQDIAKLVMAKADGTLDKITVKEQEKVSEDKETDPVTGSVMAFYRPVMRDIHTGKIDDYVEKARELLQKTSDPSIRKKLISIFKQGKNHPGIQGGIITAIAALLGGGIINVASDVHLTPYQTNLLMQAVLNTIVPTVGARMSGKNWKDTLKYTLASLGVGTGIAAAGLIEDELEETKGLPYPGTYEQENNLTKHNDVSRRITAMTETNITKSADYLEEK